MTEEEEIAKYAIDLEEELFKRDIYVNKYQMLGWCNYKMKMPKSLTLRVLKRLLVTVDTIKNKDSFFPYATNAMKACLNSGEYGRLKSEKDKEGFEKAGDIMKRILNG